MELMSDTVIAFDEDGNPNAAIAIIVAADGAIEVMALWKYCEVPLFLTTPLSMITSGWCTSSLARSSLKWIDLAAIGPRVVGAKALVAVKGELQLKKRGVCLDFCFHSHIFWQCHYLFHNAATHHTNPLANWKQIPAEENNNPNADFMSELTSMRADIICIPQQFDCFFLEIWDWSESWLISMSMDVHCSCVFVRPRGEQDTCRSRSQPYIDSG